MEQPGGALSASDGVRPKKLIPHPSPHGCLEPTITIKGKTTIKGPSAREPGVRQPTSTWLPLGDSYPSKLADGALKRPVSLHHGDADEVVRTSWGVASKERLEELGFKVSFDTYAGMAHSACPEEFDAISSFLKSSL